MNGYSHTIIDYVEQNPRIQAQQGGFILFHGNQYVPIPKWRQRRIYIDGESKDSLRKDLNTYFGINMGSIYPEAFNKVDYLTVKTDLLIKFSENNFTEIIKEVKYSLNYYFNQLLNSKFNQKHETYNELLFEIKEYLMELDITLKQRDYSSGHDRKIIRKFQDELYKVMNDYSFRINNLNNQEYTLKDNWRLNNDGQ